MSNDKLGFDLIVLNMPSNYKVTVNENDSIIMTIPAEVIYTITRKCIIC